MELPQISRYVKYLQDRAEVLSISEICNLSIFREVFPDAYKVTKLKSISKKEK